MLFNIRRFVFFHAGGNGKTVFQFTADAQVECLIRTPYFGVQNASGVPAGLRDVGVVAVPQK